MLSRLTTAVATFVLAAIALPTSTRAHAGPDCQYVDVRSGKCVITLTPSARVPVTEPISNAGSGGGAPGCLDFGVPSPCFSQLFGTWSNALQCYLRLVDPPPAPTDPLWEGHYPQGAVWECTRAGVRGTGGGWVWLPGPPTVQLSPEQAARAVVRRMDLRAAAIGIVPEDRPGRIGAVGAPVYMWTVPGPTTFGPQVLTASAGGVAITATAKVDRIEWNMGDGATVTCRTPGTVYQDGFGFGDSPDCGHRYTHTSAGQPGAAYPITATSFWIVDWTGPGGSSGQIPLDLTSSTRIVVGELQALVTR